jgi:hypothetical protein
VGNCIDSRVSKYADYVFINPSNASSGTLAIVSFSFFFESLCYCYYFLLLLLLL